MKMPAKISLTIGGIFVGIVALVFISIWQDNATARKSRKRVHQLISVGEDLNIAEQKLKRNGFRLRHEEPITPTVHLNYLQRIVIVGNTPTNSFESFVYAEGWQWMSFLRSETSYVIIDATLEGKITKIE